MPGQPASPGSLNRDEITEIIERNVQLYHQEPNFARYIAELAFYLIEHQYLGRPGSGEGTDSKPTGPEIETEGARVVYALYSKFRADRRRLFCPFCGARTKGESNCPTCRLPIQ